MRTSSILLLSAALALGAAPARGQSSQPARDPDEAALAKQHGEDLLARLREQRIAARDFLYAERLARVGLRNLEQGDLADAEYLFRKAQALVPSPNVQYHLARVQEELGSYTRAREELLRFLSSAGRWTLTRVDPARLAEARRRVSGLEARLVELRIVAVPDSASLFVDGESLGRTPRAVWLLPGSRRIALFKEGYVKHELRLQERAGARVSRRVQLLTPEQAIRSARLFREREERRLLVEARLELLARARQRRARLLRLSGYATAGAGVAALIGGAICGGLAQGSARRVETAPEGTPWPAVADDFRQAERYRTAMQAALGAGAGLVLAGGALVFFGQREGRAPVRVAPLAAGLSLTLVR